MESLGKANIVKAVEKNGKILSIKGEYDQPDKVMAYTYAAVKDATDPQHINKMDLTKYDLVVIGCSGKDIPASFLPRFREYVENGGWLLTTDWGIKTILEPLFPGYVQWNGEKTADTVVACDLVDPNHPFLHGVVDSLKSSSYKDDDAVGPKTYKNAQKIPGKSDSFKWWLEDKSFPIKVLRKMDVKVLITSYEIEKKWGAGPVYVYFPFGKGLVAHFISHTVLQKGASKGKFASAIILTNLLDECIKFKYGIDAGRSGSYQDPGQSVMSTKGMGKAAPSYGGTGAGPFASPDVQQYDPYGGSAPAQRPQMQHLNPNEGVVPSFGGVAQAVMTQVTDPTKLCAVCGLGFGADFTGNAYECTGCHTVYHEDCLHVQVNSEGTCKQCNQVLLL